MKKIVATTLACAMMFSLAACSGKQPEQTTAMISETTAETTATAETSETAQTEPSATATTVYNPASEFVKDRTEKVPDPNRVDEDGEVDESDIFVYHLPELQIKSSYADAVNKEINAAFEKYKKNYNNADVEQFYSTEYIAYLTKEGILSLVLISNGEYECNEYKVYNIDTKTGEKVDNARIAKTAGVSSIRKAAMDALQNLYNKMEIFQFKDYKIVLKKGEKKDSQMKDVEKTFSEKHLNDKMQIGLTSEGKMFFVSEIDTTAGAEFYNYIYDADGVRLDDEDNPFWVGERESDDTEEPTGTAKAPSAKILRKKDYVVNARKEYQKKYFDEDNDGCNAPKILIKSAYADSVNKEIDSIFEGYKKSGSTDGVDTGYIAYLTKSGILSVVFIEYYLAEDAPVYHVYNIDVTTGEKVDNARLAKIAGVKNIRRAAMNALEKYYDNYIDFPKVKDFKVVKKDGKELTAEEKKLEETFTETYLNENMTIGLTNKGELFFVCKILTAFYERENRVIDPKANELDWTDNKNYIGSQIGE